MHPCLLEVQGPIQYRVSYAFDDGFESGAWRMKSNVHPDAKIITNLLGKSGGNGRHNISTIITNQANDLTERMGERHFNV